MDSDYFYGFEKVARIVHKMAGVLPVPLVAEAGCYWEPIVCCRKDSGRCLGCTVDFPLEEEVEAFLSVNLAWVDEANVVLVWVLRA